MGRYILMPKLDMSMRHGTIMKWLVEEGDVLRKGDYLAEVETGKVCIQIENPEITGVVLKRYFAEGETVEINKPIAYVGEENEFAPSLQEAKRYNLYEQYVSTREEEKKKSFDYDAFIIGAGPGGYTLALRLAQMGKRVGIAEKDRLGGTCLNSGCIPVRSFVKNAQVLETVKEASLMGIDIPSFSADFRKVIQRKDEVVDKLMRGIRVMLRQNSVDVFHAEAEIASEHTISVGQKNITAESVVLATGMEKADISLQHDDSVKILAREEIIDNTTVPYNLLIVGNDMIAMEIAYIYNEYGVNVHILFENGDILPGADSEIVKILLESMKKRGIDFYHNDALLKVENAKAYLRSGKTVECDQIYFPGAQKPNTVKCYREIDRTENGFVKIDEKFTTSIPWIYAIGDITAKQFASQVAVKQASVLASILSGKNEKIKYENIPTTVFSSPEAAWVGITEQEAQRRKIPYKVSRTRFSTQGSALASSRTEGLVKVIADRRWDEILGVHIIGANASDIIAQASIAMHAELCAEDISETVFARPTFSEAFMQACAELKIKDE